MCCCLSSMVIWISVLCFFFHEYFTDSCLIPIILLTGVFVGCWCTMFRLLHMIFLSIHFLHVLHMLFLVSWSPWFFILWLLLGFSMLHYILSCHGSTLWGYSLFSETKRGRIVCFEWILVTLYSCILDILATWCWFCPLLGPWLVGHMLLLPVFGALVSIELASSMTMPCSWLLI